MHKSYSMKTPMSFMAKSSTFVMLSLLKAKPLTLCDKLFKIQSTIISSSVQNAAKTLKSRIRVSLWYELILNSINASP